MRERVFAKDNFNAFDFSIEDLKNGNIDSEYIDEIASKTCVYIQYTSDKKKYYIGESDQYLIKGSKKGRFYEHLQEDDSVAGNITFNMFDRVLIINSRFLKGNGKVLETKLLKYIDTEFKVISGRTLVNKRINQPHAEELSQDIELKLFPELWVFLKEKDFVKNDLTEVEKNPIKYYSPFGKSFDDIQKKSIERVIEIGQLTSNESRFLIKGEPGTGKTFIVATAVIELIRLGKKVAIIVNQSSMSKIYKELFNLIPSSKKPFIGSLATFENNLKNNHIVLSDFSMIIVDEAHRLKQSQGKHNYLPGTYVLDRNNMELTELDVIERYGLNIILMYDEFQLIRDSDIDIQRFKERVRGYEEIELEVQYRIQSTNISAENYTKGLRNLLQLEDVKYDNSIFGNGYNFKIVNSLSELVDYIKQKTNSSNKNARLLSGFYKEWISKGTDAFEWREAIYGVNLKWNTPNDKLGKKNWLTYTSERELQFKEVGCIHIAQGMDLDFAGVIIGKDLDVITDTNGEEILVANRKNYFDTNGIPINGTDVNNERLTEYIKKVYYILLTRGIYGTAAYFENPQVKEYFQKKLFDQ
ncbi:DNA/RNA helicase domain-containing protein [Bacillus sp. 31A1R]|uniref:DNA/RNA helicase domain-containing protein n=1 Tax=Robertmurraya mangrovi TaxID=3098077 RepID=A0ABU5ITB8_9BACI|nr:DNA/RNA helicase domain-containing protein [Bacillus sp. 31A1R]MDZ5470402.1 DNA/RNA helicase domain-containing protein [Bacillus sp. 31A1R]